LSGLSLFPPNVDADISYLSGKASRLVQVTDIVGNVVAYEYDADGNLLSALDFIPGQTAIGGMSPVQGRVNSQVMIYGNNLPVHRPSKFNGTVAAVSSATPRPSL
jgi:YD repeat-containing protein